MRKAKEWRQEGREKERTLPVLNCYPTTTTTDTNSSDAVNSQPGNFIQSANSFHKSRQNKHQPVNPVNTSRELLASGELQMLQKSIKWTFFYTAHFKQNSIVVSPDCTFSESKVEL